MNQKSHQKLEKLRSKGKSEFILVRGGLYFGLFVYGFVIQVVRAAVEYIFADYSFSFFDKGYQIMIFFNLFIAFPAGCALGWIVWKRNEKDFLRSDDDLK